MQREDRQRAGWLLVLREQEEREVGIDRAGGPHDLRVPHAGIEPHRPVFQVKPAVERHAVFLGTGQLHGRRRQPRVGGDDHLDQPVAQDLGVFRPRADLPEFRCRPFAEEPGPLAGKERPGVRVRGSDSDVRAGMPVRAAARARALRALRSRPLTPPGIMMSDRTTSICARVGQRAQRGFGARDVSDGEARGVQHLARERRHLLVVLDEQHVTAARPVERQRYARRLGVWRNGSRASAAAAASRSCRRRPRCRWSPARPTAARSRRPAAARARSLADVLGREERLERACQHLGRHPDAGVGDRQLDEVRLRPRSSATCTFSAVMMTPPSGIASRAFRHRFRIASSISPASTSTGQTSGSKFIWTSMWPPSEPSSISRMPLRWAAMSIDSGLTGRRRENASRCRVRPVPRATARRMPSKTRGAAGGDVALEQLQAAREHREQVVEVVRDAAGQLAERFHLLRLPQRRLGLPQPLLIAQALGHVVDELVGADAVAVAIAQRVVAHLVGAPIARRIAELVDRRELLAGQRPAPHRLRRPPGARAAPRAARACCRRPWDGRRRCARIRRPRRG